MFWWLCMICVGGIAGSHLAIRSSFMGWQLVACRTLKIHDRNLLTKYLTMMEPFEEATNSRPEKSRVQCYSVRTGTSIQTNQYKRHAVSNSSLVFCRPTQSACLNMRQAAWIFWRQSLVFNLPRTTGRPYINVTNQIAVGAFHCEHTCAYNRARPAQSHGNLEVLGTRILNKGNRLKRSQHTVKHTVGHS